MQARQITLVRMLVLFLKLGSIGFGGGMAVIALMEQEFVGKRGLLKLDEFVHGVGLSQLLGPFAVNASIFVGARLFGTSGGLLAAAAFTAPSVGLVIALSDLYFRYHAVPALASTVGGLGPVVIALILTAAWSIGRRILNSARRLLVAAVAAGAAIWGVNPALILLLCGAAGWLLAGKSWKAPGALMVAPLLGPIPVLVSTFLKVGLVFFGGGFVLVPLLHERLVRQLGWLTPQEFLDGVAISNLTPGPIAVLATFAGYHQAGVMGALLATAALFAPAAALMLVLSRQYGRLRDDERVRKVLAGLNPAVAGLIVSAAVVLGRQALVSWQDGVLGVVSLALLALRWPPVAVLALGAAAGYFRLV